jgi:hypothetical protein
MVTVISIKLGFHFSKMPGPTKGPTRSPNVGTGIFTGAQRPGRDVQHWLPLLLRLSGSTTLLPLYAFMWRGTSAYCRD